jgi:hypothetical protein
LDRDAAADPERLRVMLNGEPRETRLHRFTPSLAR